jgi:hypothetical protein
MIEGCAFAETKNNNAMRETEILFMAELFRIVK